LGPPVFFVRWILKKRKVWWRRDKKKETRQTALARNFKGEKLKHGLHEEKPQRVAGEDVVGNQIPGGEFLTSGKTKRGGGLLK